LEFASFKKALLEATNLNGADIDGSFLNGALYTPLTTFNPSQSLEGIHGLSEATYIDDLYDTPDSALLNCVSAFNVNEAPGPGALVRLRKILADNGFREREREATFAIEHTYTKDEIRSWRYSGNYPWPTNWLRSADGIARLLLFEWTTEYGLYPSRALLLILAIWAILVPWYAFAIISGTRRGVSMLYRIWPSGRIDTSRDRKLIIENSARVEPLKTNILGAIAWGCYFSLLSTFQIGYKDLSIGSWIIRTQPRAFTLEPNGWLRTVSGVQSLVSVYLFAMWLLTYFGRPFQ
jgi:hypothetical protein